LVSLLGLPFQVLMPVFASGVLHGGPNTLGMLMAATGVGALAGVAALANRKTVLGLGRVIAASTGILGLALIAFGLSRVLWLSLCILPVAGFHPARGRFRNDAANGGLQYCSSNPRGRRDAGPSDGILLDGICGDGAVWKLDRRPVSGAGRRLPHGNCLRHLLPRWSADFPPAIASYTRRRSPDLCKARDPPASGRATRVRWTAS
jgi:hypothetical protein